MKKNGLLLICGLVALVIAFALWAGRGISFRTVSNKSFLDKSSAIGVKPAASSPVSPTLLKSNEWQQFRSDREAVLNANPQLSSEYKTLLNEMDAQQKSLESAMVKADPKAVPTIAKLESIRKHVPARNGKPSDVKAKTLTPTEWQEIRTARMAALKANPDFDTKAIQLSAEMRAFQDELTTAMIKADPAVAPVVVKFNGGHPVPNTVNPPSKAD